MKPTSYRHLGFTGSKDRITPIQVDVLYDLMVKLRNKGFLWMHNGDCITSDQTAGLLWSSHKIGGMLMLHPPSNPSLRANLVADIVCEPRDYIHRDRHIVLCSELIIATPQTSYEEIRSGTWTTVRYARKQRRKIFIIKPDGTVRKE
jgi:hypothetical protein